MNKLLLVAVFIIFYSCNSKHEQPEKQTASKDTTKTVPEVPKTEVIKYQPEKEQRTDLGVVFFDDEPFTVVGEYTDSIVLSEPIINKDKIVEGSYNYRQMLVKLISKDKADTITLQKSDFKNKIDKDYDDFLLSYVQTNQKVKSEIIPVIISLCLPESDACWRFAIDINKGKAEISEFLDEELLYVQNSGYATAKYFGVYSYGTNADEGPIGNVTIYPEDDDHILFYLDVNRGAPSYNMGALYGRIKIKDDKGVYYKDTAKDDAECQLLFTFKGDALKIGVVGNNNNCGFGNGVFADGTYQRVPKEYPLTFTNGEGTEVDFRYTKPEDYYNE
ncbi:hypothetical protein [Flavobacterium rhizosphaerae]|uniref:DKNYY family protein n=1 Tax=Flavobacterium rhizosphaerae TaxID=3163298 RepID=A0ABW8YXH1_9FLAO